MYELVVADFSVCESYGVRTDLVAGVVRLRSGVDLSLLTSYRTWHHRRDTQARFPLPELTARVNGPS